MGDEEDGHAVAPLDVLDERQDLRLRRHIEGRGRLVGDQQRRLQGERHGDHDALALAAGKLVRVGVVELLRSDEHTSELQSLMRISYAGFCLKKKRIKSMKDRTKIKT